MNEERSLALKLSEKEKGKDKDDDFPGPSLAAILLEKLKAMQVDPAADEVAADELSA